jgi:hypothetical protein
MAGGGMQMAGGEAGGGAMASRRGMQMAVPQ